MKRTMFYAAVFVLCLAVSPLVFAQDAAPKKDAVVQVAPVKDAAAPAPTPIPAPVATITPVVAPVAETTQTWWQALLLPVLSALGLALAAFLTIGLRKLVQLIERKWSIDIPNAVENQISIQAQLLLAWAEEKAENRLLNGDGKPTPGAEKITSVVNALEAFVAARGWSKEWQRDKLEMLAEGILHMERSDNAGIGTTSGDRKVRLDAVVKSEK